jgi:hypothetical protein
MYKMDLKGALPKHRIEYQEVKDNPRLLVRKGDIVRIPDTDNYPKYARGEYAVVLSRYRYIKHKYIKYIDYGAVVMFITGERKGHSRRFYCKIHNSMKYIF